MTFPEAVRSVREDLSMTQAEFGRALNVSFATVNRWENGKHFPTPLVLDAIRTYCQKKNLVFPYDDKPTLVEGA